MVSGENFDPRGTRSETTNVAGLPPLQNHESVLVYRNAWGAFTMSGIAKEELGQDRRAQSSG